MMRSRRYRSYFLWILAVALLVLSAVPSFANRTIRVGVYDCDPLSKTQPANQDKGFFLDIIDYVAREEKWNVQYIPGTLKEGFERLNSDHVDLLVAAPYSDKTSRNYDFTRESVISTWAQIYYSPDLKAIQSLLDLKNLTIGIVRDDVYNSELLNVVTRLNVPCNFAEFSNYEDLFTAIQNKWVDAGAVDRFYGILHAKHYAVTASPVIFSPVELRYAAAKNRHPEIIETLSYHITVLKKNPNSIYYQLADRISGTTRDSRIYRVLVWSVMLTLTFLCILALMILILRNQIKKQTRELIRKNDELEKENARRCIAEESLRESEELYRTLAERSFAHVFVVQDGVFRLANSNLVRTLEMPGDEIIGRRSLDFIHEEDRELVKSFSRQMLQGRRNYPYEYRMKTKSGRTLWTLETVTFIQYEGRPAVLGTAIDISEQKKADEERRSLESQLRQAQKMEAIGTLAGGIAHDFNNILAAILGYTELAYFHIKGRETERRYLNEVLKACERARDLITQILTFSRKDEQTLHPVHITPVIKEAVKLLRASLPATIDIQLEIDAADDRIQANPTQIHQVMMNLCTNAAHAMNGEGGTLTIKLSNRAASLDQPDAPLMADMRFWELQVSDTGHGIPTAIIERIFDPFFTTKDVGKGTGMGLSVVHGIVKGHGGTIRVESEVNRGSTFFIRLPLAMEIAAEEECQSSSSPHPKGKERILVVDDEALLVEMCREMLTHLGYHITATTSSREALAIFKNQPEKFDLVITDMTMPEMVGIELARKLTEIKSDIPIILCTGYNEDLTPEMLKAASVRECMMKPFGHSKMASAIRRVLDVKPARMATPAAT